MRKISVTGRGRHGAGDGNCRRVILTRKRVCDLIRSTRMHVGKAPPLPNVEHWTADLGTRVKVAWMTNVLIKVRIGLTCEIT